MFLSKKQKLYVKYRQRLYNVLTLPILLYGTVRWTIRAKTKSMIMAAEVKFMRKTLRYNWTDYKAKH